MARIDETPRFDQYSVQPSKVGLQVVQLISNIDFVFAAVLAEVIQDDFEQSVFHTGWVGTCPYWLKYMPVVTIPQGDLLGEEHLDFMIESLLSRAE